MNFNLLSTMEILISHWLSRPEIQSYVPLTYLVHDNRHSTFTFLPYDFFCVCSIVSGATDMILLISPQFLHDRLFSSLHFRTV